MCMIGYHSRSGTTVRMYRGGFDHEVLSRESKKTTHILFVQLNLSRCSHSRILEKKKITCQRSSITMNEEDYLLHPARVLNFELVLTPSVYIISSVFNASHPGVYESEPKRDLKKLNQRDSNCISRHTASWRYFETSQQSVICFI